MDKIKISTGAPVSMWADKIRPGQSAGKCSQTTWADQIGKTHDGDPMQASLIANNLTAFADTLKKAEWKKIPSNDKEELILSTTIQAATQVDFDFELRLKKIPGDKAVLELRYGDDNRYHAIEGSIELTNVSEVQNPQTVKVYPDFHNPTDQSSKEVVRFSDTAFGSFVPVGTPRIKGFLQNLLEGIPQLKEHLQ